MSKQKSSGNISDLKPLSPEIEGIFDRLIVRLINSHLIGSTLVEGSTFTEVEARSVIEGKSIYGHIVDEHLELLNGKECASFIHRIFFQKENLSVNILDQAHGILFKDMELSKSSPGMNRSQTGLSAYTILLNNGKTVKHEYEHPQVIARDYLPFINFHLNRLLQGDVNSVCLRLAELYFHFQMLHPYSDGNGRLGRFLVSAKVASERGLFFRFELADGPQHLDIMMEMTKHYSADRRSVNFLRLKTFIQDHLEGL
jgi:Fic family protein